MPCSEMVAVVLMTIDSNQTFWGDDLLFVVMVTVALRWEAAGVINVLVEIQELIDVDMLGWALIKQDREQQVLSKAN